MQGKIGRIDNVSLHAPAMATQNGACKTVLAGTIAKKLLSEVQDGLNLLDRQPRLHGFLANKDPAAKMYADWTAKTCEEKYEVALSHCLKVLKEDEMADM